MCERLRRRIDVRHWLDVEFRPPFEKHAIPNDRRGLTRLRAVVRSKAGGQKGVFPPSCRPDVVALTRV